MELVIAFADLAGDPRFTSQLSCPFTFEGSHLDSAVLSQSASLVEHMRSTSPLFASATSAHPDSYWPMLFCRTLDGAAHDTTAPAGLPRYACGDGLVSFEIKWDYCVVWSTSEGTLANLRQRTEALLAHWAEVRTSIEETRSLIDLVDADRHPDLDECRRSLQEQQMRLTTSLMRSDQRTDCVWEYEIRFLDLAGQVWGVDRFEMTANRTLAAARTHIDQIAEQQSRRTAAETAAGIRTARQLLLLITLAGGLATLIAVLEYLADPSSASPQNIGRLGIFAIAVAGLALVFHKLRASAEQLSTSES